MCLDAVLWYHWLVWLEELHASCTSSHIILMVWPLSNAYIPAFTWYMGYTRDPKAPQPDKWKILTLGSQPLTYFNEEWPPESTGEKNQWTLLAQNAHINQYELRWLTTSLQSLLPKWSTPSTNKTCSHMTQHIHFWWWIQDTVSEMSDMSSTFTWLTIGRVIITS